MNAKEFAENHKIFECIAGSVAYEINTPESDVDVRGVFLPPLSELINPFNAVSQVNEKNQDEQFYSFPKFYHLLIDQNPNIIELLWMPEDKIQFKLPCWDELRLHKDKFLSKKSYWKFSHYATSQMNRIKGHNKWITKEEQGKQKLLNLLESGYINLSFIRRYFHESVYQFILDVCQNKNFAYVSCVDLDHKIFDINDFDIRLISNKKPCQYHYIKIINRDTGEQEREFSLDELNSFGAKKMNNEFFILYENGLGIFDKLGNFRSNLSGEFDKSNPKYFMSFASEQYKQDCESWKNYWEWRNNRNPKRAELEYKHGFDSKHAGHLIRLLYVGYHILKDQIVYVVLPDEEKQVVRDIRKGKYTYEEVIDLSTDLQKSTEELLKTSTLRANIDLDKAKEIYYNIVTKHLGIKERKRKYDVTRI